MTTTNDALSALTALRLAFGIVSSPCSAAETQRAEVLLGIAREIREEAQYRATRSALTSTLPARPSKMLPTPVPAAAEAPPADPEATAVVPLDYGQRYQDDPAITQRIRTPWSVGDKADCRHCHTPIELAEAEVTGPYAGDYAGASMWRHKYTGQAVCADAHMGPAEGGFPGHTFAEPSID